MMFVSARRKMKGKVAGGFLRLLAPSALFVMGWIVAIPGMLCPFYGTAGVLEAAGLGGWYRPWTGLLIPVLLWGTGAVLLLFSAAFAFYARGWICFAFDKNQTRPKSLLRPSQAWRYVRCRAGVFCRNVLWLLAYLLPAALPAAVLLLAREAPWLSAALRVVLITAAASLLAAGVGFFAVSSSRYYMATYLLYLNPLMPPKEAIRSSARLTRGRLLAVTARRLSLAPWGLTELLVLPLPFAAVYRRFCAVALCERLFGEDKRRAPSPAVVFYISRKSKISKAESGAQ